MLEKLKALGRDKPVVVLAAVVGFLGAVNEAVVASVEPTDGWKPVGLAALAYVLNRLVKEA